MNLIQINPFFQHTLARPLYFIGRGLHSGKSVRLTLLPAETDSGYVFERTDQDQNRSRIPARWYTVTDTRLSTSVSNGFGISVGTIEHLMSALIACGVDNCRMLVDGPEIPIMDGSAEVFVDNIQSVGLQMQKKERKAMVITKPIWVYEDKGYAGFIPFPQPWIDMTIDFDSSAIGQQSYSMPVDSIGFSNIAKARTFGFEDQIETLQKMGLALGGSLSNAILVNDQGVVNEEGLHYENEFVRHKTLDAIGDIGLANSVIFGRFVGYCSGHSLNNKLLREACQRRNTICFTTVRDAMENWSNMIGSVDYSEIKDAHWQ